MTSSETDSPSTSPLRRFDLRFWRRSPSLRAAIALLAAAIAVVLCTIGARAIVRDPLHPSGVTVGKAVSGGLMAASTPGQSPVVEPAGAIKPVPSDFVTWAASSRFGSTQYVLGRSVCSGTMCPALLRTDDAGRTWRQVHTFAQADASAAIDAAQPTIQPAGAVSDVRFISRTTGFVFGSDLWVTHDSGRSFTQVQHPGTSVLDVVVRGGQPLALTSAGCIQGTCSGRLEVDRISISSTPSLGSAIAGVSPSDAIADAGLVVAGRNVLLTSRGEKTGNGASATWGLAVDALAPLSTGPACNNKPLEAVADTEQTRIIALCDAVVSATSTSYSTVSSDDGGTTWRLIGAGNVTLPTQGHVSLSSGSGDVLAATSGGPREAVDGTTRSSTSTAAVTSRDGGKTWTPAHLDGGNPEGGFDSVVDDGVSLVALTRTDGSLWRSPTLGGTWSRQQLSRP